MTARAPAAQTRARDPVGQHLAGLDMDPRRSSMVCRAAVAAGADGLLIEVHPTPERALSDGVQTISTEEFAELMRQCRAIAEVIGRRVAEPAEVG